MSNLSKQYNWVAATLCLLAVFSTGLVSTDAMAADLDKPVFDFQNKLASQGNAQAQYYLAQMYEEGRGTKADPEMAKHWYEQARSNGYNPATQASSAY